MKVQIYEDKMVFEYLRHFTEVNSNSCSFVSTNYYEHL